MSEKVTRRGMIGAIGAAVAVSAVPIRMSATKSDDASDQVLVTVDPQLGGLIVRARLFVYDGTLTHYHCDHPIRENHPFSGFVPPEESACPDGISIATKKYAVLYIINEEVVSHLGDRVGAFAKDVSDLARKRVGAMPDELYCPEMGIPVAATIPHSIRKKYGISDNLIQRRP